MWQQPAGCVIIVNDMSKSLSANKFPPIVKGCEGNLKWQPRPSSPPPFAKGDFKDAIIIYRQVLS
jgi:hypothetical protein